MARPKKPQPRTYRPVSISITTDVWEHLRSLAKDDQGRDLAGGVSGVIRSIVLPHLARRAKREAARS